MSRKTTYIIVFVCLLILSFSLAPIVLDQIFTNNLLGLQEFYGYGDCYSRIFKNATQNENSEVNPFVQPLMGWKTDGKPVENPTKVASEGLSMILKGDVEGAEKRAQWLLINSSCIENGLFFPFRFDFVPYWPYSLKAPWNSALTQGLALGLFSYLYSTFAVDR